MGLIPRVLQFIGETDKAYGQVLHHLTEWGAEWTAADSDDEVPALELVLYFDIEWVSAGINLVKIWRVQFLPRIEGSSRSEDLI